MNKNKTYNKRKIQKITVYKIDYAET